MASARHLALADFLFQPALSPLTFLFHKCVRNHISAELFTVRLRISDQMLGGIVTSRLNVTRVPPRSSPEAWGHGSAIRYANASRYRAAVLVSVMGVLTA